LESAFVSAFRVMTVWPIFPFDKFNNIAKIGRVQSPILILHGTQDDVVPFYHGQWLFETAREPKQFFTAKSSGHDVLSTGGPELDNVIVEFARSVKTTNRSR